MPMNCSPHRNRAAPDKRTIEDLLESIRVHFYAGHRPAQFHRDRRMLLYAVTRPAAWLEHRGLFCSPRRYRQLVQERLDAVRAYGDPRVWADYFPRYLLKCLQSFFARHGDDLYHELKHIRNALESLQRSLVFAQRAAEQSRQIEALAAAHRVLQAGHHGRSHPDPGQLALF
jgi:hypothetical protein